MNGLTVQLHRVSTPCLESMMKSERDLQPSLITLIRSPSLDSPFPSLDSTSGFTDLLKQLEILFRGPRSLLATIASRGFLIDLLLGCREGSIGR